MYTYEAIHNQLAIKLLGVSGPRFTKIRKSYGFARPVV